jgi:hypothetical protein
MASAWEWAWGSEVALGLAALGAVSGAGLAEELGGGSVSGSGAVSVWVWVWA